MVPVESVAAEASHSAPKNTYMYEKPPYLTVMLENVRVVVDDRNCWVAGRKEYETAIVLGD